MLRFNFQDPFPSLALEDIHPISVRAKSWLARVSKQSGFMDKPSTQIAGAVFMLGGLDYHHHQFMLRIKQLAPYYERKKNFLDRIKESTDVSSVFPPMPTEKEGEHQGALHHEAFAYINRLGQFFSFAKAVHLENMMPRTKQLISFRNKHTAHRSIDKPRGEPFELQEIHAMAFNFYQLSTGSLFPIFQIYDQEQHINFHMDEDHTIVLKEAMALLQSLFHQAE